MSAKVWIDLANSPHVPLFAPVVERLESEGFEIVLTARRHAQTVDLASELWPTIRVVGGASPPGVGAKARSFAARVRALCRFASDERPDVAVSHGSYAQLAAARLVGVPAVTMMDYEHQPANHLSFRLARAVVVPEAFPEAALRRCGAAQKARRYSGFKEELYLAGFAADPRTLDELELDPERVLVVMRPPPHGALYHRDGNDWFDAVVDDARSDEGVQVVVLPRSSEQRERYAGLPGVTVPPRVVDGRSLLALADATVGAGGTMNRESALLGTPTYTVFAGRLAAVDARLIQRGLMHDLRAPGASPEWERKRPHAPTAAHRPDGPLEILLGVIRDCAAP